MFKEYFNNEYKDNHTFQLVRQALKNAIFSVLFISLFVNLLVLAGPIYSLQVFDRVLTSSSYDTLMILTAMVLIAHIALQLLESVRAVIMVRVGHWLQRKLGSIFLYSSLHYSLQKPDINILNDLTTVSSFIGGKGCIAMIDIPWSIIFLIVLWLLHPYLALLALVAIIILTILTIITRIINKNEVLATNVKKRHALNLANDYARAAPAIIGMGMQKNVIHNWNKRWNEALQTQSHEKNTYISNVSRFFRQISQVLAVTLAAYLVLKGELTAGSMLAGTILMARCLAPIDQVIAHWSPMLEAQEAYKKICIYLSENVEEKRTNLPAPSGRITAHNLNYTVEGQEQPLFYNEAFFIESGELVLITAPSGVGKSTLCRMIVGAVKPRLGSVRIDGVDSYDWAKGNLGSFIGYMPQEVMLLPGTIKENIERFSDAPDAEVIKAAQKAGAHELILQFEHNYDTFVDPSTAKLSGGQRQRIGLARALFGDPRIVVLDEPFSHLDQAGIVALKKCIAILKQEGVTIIVVSHEIIRIFQPDRILQIRDGIIYDMPQNKKIPTDIKTITKKKTIS